MGKEAPPDPSVRAYFQRLDVPFTDKERNELKEFYKKKGIEVFK